MNPNKNEITATDAAFIADGVDAIEVLSSLVKAKQVKEEAEAVKVEAEVTYALRCAQTPAIYASIASGRLAPKDYAEATGLTTMTIGRYKAAGHVLYVHPGLNPEDVVKYANGHNTKECSALTEMTEEDARAIVSPEKEKSRKTEAEKDLEAITRVLSRIRKADSIERVEALDGGITELVDAIAQAYYAVSNVVTAEDIA
jgi:hypothetical protein